MMAFHLHRRQGRPGETRACPAQNSRRLRIRRAFTLIELLTVIGLMALIMAISIPSFVGIARSSKMRGARDNLRATLTLSRQWSITHRQKTFVVFPNNINDNNANDKGFRAYRAYTDASGYIGEWRYLPEGIVFINTVDTNHAGNVFDLTLIPAAKKRSFPSLAGTDTPYISYTPDGSMGDIGSSYRNIYITEGMISSLHLPVILNTQLVYRIQLMGRTGGIRVTDIIQNL